MGEVGPIILTVSQLGEGVRRRLPIEAGIRHVVEWEVVVEGEKFAEVGDEVLLDGPLGWRILSLVVVPVFVKDRDGDPEKVFCHDLAIPRLG